MKLTLEGSESTPPTVTVILEGPRFGCAVHERSVSSITTMGLEHSVTRKLCEELHLLESWSVVVEVGCP